MRKVGVSRQDPQMKRAQLYERWGRAPRGQQSGAGLKPLQAAVVKSGRGERCRKRRDQISSGTIRRGEREQTADDVSKRTRRCQNRGCDFLPGRARGQPWRPPERHPAYRRREAGSGSCMERENLSSRCEGRSSSGENREGQSTDAGHRGRVARSRVEGPVIGPDRRGCIVQPKSTANRQRDEHRAQARSSDDFGRRLNIGSRMKRELHVRIWERLGVKFPWANR